MLYFSKFTPALRITPCREMATQTNNILNFISSRVRIHHGLEVTVLTNTSFVQSSMLRRNSVLLDPNYFDQRKLRLSNVASERSIVPRLGYLARDVRKYLLYTVYYMSWFILFI